MKPTLTRSTSGSRPISVTAFVDWNTHMRNIRAPESKPEDRAQRTLAQTARVIGRALAQAASASRFDVAFRLYHGWYKGWQRTENFDAITTAVSQTDFSRLSQAPNVVFSSDVRYSHTLMSALPERSHVRPPIHLPDTLRQQVSHEPPTEKMVDSALASDLLAWAHSDPGDWALILSDDDDVVPPVFTAEAWTKPHGGRVLIVRTRRTSRAFLKLNGLLMELTL